MRAFLAFVKKEFWHVLRDKRSLAILLGMPVVLILIFGFALSSEVKNSPVAILDSSGDEISRSIINRIEASAYFEIAHRLTKFDDLEKLFKENEVLLGVVIPTGFSQDLIGHGRADLQVIGSAVDPNTTNTAIQYLKGLLLTEQLELLQSEASQPYQIDVSIRMMYNPQLESSYLFVPGVMTLVLMLLGAMMTSVSIVREKELGTMEVLLVSPMKPILVILSKAVPYLVLSFIDVLIILLLAYTVLDMPVRGNLFLLLSMCVLFIITALSLGLLISTLVESQQVAMFLSLVGFLMPALVFSGFMFPIENMPAVLQAISNVVPTRWFFDILKNVMIKGLGLDFIVKPAIILLAMTLFFLTIAIRKFKIRLM